jgi:hypothetical protein
MGGASSDYFAFISIENHRPVAVLDILDSVYSCRKRHSIWMMERTMWALINASPRTLFGKFRIMKFQLSYTVEPILSHTTRWTAKRMGYWRLWDTRSSSKKKALKNHKKITKNHKKNSGLLRLFCGLIGVPKILNL